MEVCRQDRPDEKNRKAEGKTHERYSGQIKRHSSTKYKSYLSTKNWHSLASQFERNIELREAYPEVKIRVYLILGLISRLRPQFQVLFQPIEPGFFGDQHEKLKNKK